MSRTEIVCLLNGSHLAEIMDEAGSDLMLINKNNYKMLLDVLIQVRMRNQLTRDEVEVLKKFVDIY